MPLLNHFHPPLHGPRRWKGFHHAWATGIAAQLNQGLLPADYFAEPEISVGPELEVDVAALERNRQNGGAKAVATKLWSPARPKIVVGVEFAHLDSFEIKVYQELGGAELRAAIELISPANKDREGSRRSFAAKCASYLKHGIGVVMVDIVTLRSANLHEELFDVLEVKSRRPAWRSPTGLYAVPYRSVATRKSPRVEAWPEKLCLGEPLPEVPLWLALDLCIPVLLEDSYVATCRSLRIPA
jgi:hypothetical protein